MQTSSSEDRSCEQIPRGDYGTRIIRLPLDGPERETDALFGLDYPWIETISERFRLSVLRIAAGLLFVVYSGRTVRRAKQTTALAATNSPDASPTARRADLG